MLNFLPFLPERQQRRKVVLSCRNRIGHELPEQRQHFRICNGGQSFGGFVANDSFARTVGLGLLLHNFVLRS
jgi:hypothetical protein